MSAPTRTDIETKLVDQTCRGCGNAFLSDATLIDGNLFAHYRQCEDCRAAEDARISRLRRDWRTDREAADVETRRARAVKFTDELDVPDLYAGVSIETWHLHGTDEDMIRQQRMQSHGMKYIASWPEVEYVTLVLRGGTGTGKGHWCWSIAKAVAGMGYSVRFRKLADLVRELRRSWRSGEGESEEAALRRYRELDLLIIDEISSHAFYGEQIHQHLYDVIDHRVDHRRPTILTSNEDNEGLGKILRAAVLSRIHGSGGLLEFGAGPDYRLRPRTAREG